MGKDIVLVIRKPGVWFYLLYLCELFNVYTHCLDKELKKTLGHHKNQVR